MIPYNITVSSIPGGASAYSATDLSIKMEADFSYNIHQAKNCPYCNNVTSYNTNTGKTNSDDSLAVQSESVEKIKCSKCEGTRKCKECNGTGRIAIEKTGINLGGGSGTYNEYRRCPLCDGKKTCYWCGGTGYEPFQW